MKNKVFMSILLFFIFAFSIGWGSVGWNQLKSAVENIQELTFKNSVGFDGPVKVESILYAPNVPSMSLSNWDAAIAKMQQGSTEQAVIAWIGDSWVGGETVCLPVKTALQAAYGNAGVGYVHLNSSSSAPTGSSRTILGTWTDVFQTTSAIGLNAAHTASVDIVTPASISVTATATDFVLHYGVQADGGSFTYAIDGGGTTEVSTAVTNYLTYPNTFSSWTSGSSNEASATSDSSITNPFGGASAWKLIEDTDNSEHYIYQAWTHEAETYTYSLYAKAGTRSWVHIADRGTGTYPTGVFNLSAGTASGSGTSIISVGNGWYRCSLTFTSSAGNQNTIIKVSNSSNAVYDGDGESYVYIYGAQMEKSATASQYLYDSIAYETLEITGLSNESHEIALVVSAAGANGVVLIGVEANIDVTGVRVHRIPSTGSTATTFVNVDAEHYIQGLKNLDPDVVVISLGTNELLSNVIPSTQIANIEILASRIAFALPYADILLVPQPELGVTGTYTTQEYSDAQRAAAYENGWGFVDIYNLVGPYSATSVRGLWTNTTHVNTYGGQVISNYVMRHLLR